MIYEQNMNANDNLISHDFSCEDVLRFPAGYVFSAFQQVFHSFFPVEGKDLRPF